MSRLGGFCAVADPSVDAVVAGVSPLLENYEVYGVVSCGEYFVNAAGALAALLRLPGAGWAAANTSRNKLLQRVALPEFSPQWRAVLPGHRDHAIVPTPDCPAIVKPTGRMSSSGVVRLDDPHELPDLLASYPDQETLLVEELLTGPEFSVEALVQDGQVVWAGVTRKDTTGGAGGVFVETAHTSGPAEPIDQDLLTTHGEVLRKIGFRHGVSHGEYRRTSDGIMLMEVALRIPGDGICVLWELATGASMEERIVDAALGIPISYPIPTRRARHLYLDLPRGELVDVHCDAMAPNWTMLDGRWPSIAPTSADAPPRICAVLVSQLPGDTLGPLCDSDSRAVSVIVDAPLDRDVDEVAVEAAMAVDVVIQ